jgi:23S rRNA pseudouridine955/2504/2580 synthase
MRLDRWFKSHYPGLGFGHLQKLLRSGQVRVDGGRAKADTRVEPGQTVRVPPLGVDRKADGPLTPRTMRGHEDGELLARMVLHEDDKVFVLDKPAGLAVQGGSGVTRSVDSMLEAWRNKKGEKPRLVHRLDRDTSGVMVFARTPAAQRHLGLQFERRHVAKVYVARVRGRVAEEAGTVDLPLKVDWPNRPLQHVHPEGRPAVTNWRVIRREESETRLRLYPQTGRSHQLRVHMKEIGHPILGDPLYAAGTAGDFQRLMLHAESLKLRHPEGGAEVSFLAKCPF